MTAKEVVLKLINEAPEPEPQPQAKSGEGEYQYYEVTDFRWAYAHFLPQWSLDRVEWFNPWVFGSKDRAGELVRSVNKSGKPGPFWYVEYEGKPFAIGHAGNPGMWYDYDNDPLPLRWIRAFEKIFKEGGPRIQKIVGKRMRPKQLHYGMVDGDYYNGEGEAPSRPHGRY